MQCSCHSMILNTSRINNAPTQQQSEDSGSMSDKCVGLVNISKDYLDTSILSRLRMLVARMTERMENQQPVLLQLELMQPEKTDTVIDVGESRTRLLSYGRVFNVVVSLRSCGRDQGDTEISISSLDIQVGAVGEHKVCLPRDIRNSMQARMCFYCLGIRHVSVYSGTLRS